MGYNITIGNAYLDAEPDEGLLEIRVKGFNNDDAPNHCEFTGTGSSRSPSYTVWNEFCRAAGIHMLFFGNGWNKDLMMYDYCDEGFHREVPLMANHPGVALLTMNDYRYIADALQNYKTKYPEAVPGFWDWDKKNFKEIPNGKDPVLARLIWLEYWINWALANCEYPAIGNT